MRKAELVLDARATLGECPRWRRGEQALYWVDIAERRLHRFDPATGATRSVRFDQPVGCFAFRRAGGLVLAMADGFALLDDMDGRPQPFGAQVEAGRPDTRFNDGRADPRGRFWAGTVNMPKREANGTLYRLTADGEAAVMAGGALTSNGVAFSPDATVLYFADTPRHVVYAFDFDLEAGALGARRVFHQFPSGEGRPDGASVDAEGCYWTALFDGGRVVRLSPAGEILEEVTIPARRPTMVGFAGPDLRTAYVTTAREGLEPDELERQPQSGGLFSFRVDVPGLPENLFGA